MNQDQVIRLLNLAPHPEGGHYREIYRSPECIPAHALPERYSGDRAFSTTILFLLGRGGRSRLHRLASDEVWHYHLGGPLDLWEITPSGAVRRTTLGPDLDAGQHVAHSVPAGTWLGAENTESSPWTLVGCTVAPGFTFQDFELGDPEALLALAPDAADLVRRLG